LILNRYSLSHLSSPALRNVLHDRGVTVRFSDADFIAAIAEFDARKDYLAEGYPSMKSYCIQELELPEESAAKRIRVARAARDFPAIFDALADGRLHLSAVVLLAPHLLPETASELIAAAAHRSKSEIEKLLSERFARVDVPNLQAQVVANAWSEQSPGTVAPEFHVTEQSPGTVDSPFAQAPGHATTPSRTSMRLMIEDDALRSARELLAHQFPSGNDSDIVNLALRQLVQARHKRKFGAPKQRAPRKSSSNPRPHPSRGVRTGRWPVHVHQ
jgi:Arc/MetJ family transcription regulator